MAPDGPRLDIDAVVIMPRPPRGALHSNRTRLWIMRMPVALWRCTLGLTEKVLTRSYKIYGSYQII